MIDITIAGVTYSGKLVKEIAPEPGQCLGCVLQHLPPEACPKTMNEDRRVLVCGSYANKDGRDYIWRFGDV